jgi:hypothetical protein
MIKYDGTFLDLSGLNIPALTAGSGSLSFGLGYLQLKRELYRQQPK